MTNEELFTDLKQFIAATVSQEVAGLRDELKADIKGVEQRLDARIDGLDEKLDTIQDAIAESFTHANEVTNESISGIESTLEEHEQRLHRLEHRSV